MIGAIAGDIIGSVYEHAPIKTKDSPLFHPQCCFTDDTVLTIAIAKAILDDRNYLQAVWELGRKYPHAGYGGSFLHWLHSTAPKPYHSWGNGSAMRVSPVGFAFDTVDTVLREAARTAEISHNHPEGVKGAQATALSVATRRRCPPQAPHAGGQTRSGSLLVSFGVGFTLLCPDGIVYAEPHAHKTPSQCYATCTGDRQQG
jgi:ADP-ribosylglycohydrolase